ncbi:MAG: L-threonylcarbamoyladenylate synthase [Candidatus Moranbacteria bacterium]|nr:L-threonylcarbamoyladenylate synthase [Candidatus Moranbacteria bacterium]
MKNQTLLEIRKTISPILLAGGIGVLPTDTLYGVVGSALNKKTVGRIFELRQRESDKPMIILIASLVDLKKFGIVPSPLQKKMLNVFWPGKISVVLECQSKKFKHLHRGKNTLAFRIPADAELQKLLKKVGPLVAPSANMSGKKPATTYSEAREYFSDNVDFYVDCGKLKSKPSTLIEMDKNGEITILRQGAVKIAKKALLR